MIKAGEHYGMGRKKKLKKLKLKTKKKKKRNMENKIKGEDDAGKKKLGRTNGSIANVESSTRTAQEKKKGREAEGEASNHLTLNAFLKFSLTPSFPNFDQ